MTTKRVLYLLSAVLILLGLILSGCVNVIATYDYKEKRMTTVDFASFDKEVIDMVYEEVDDPNDPFDTTLWTMKSPQGKKYYSLMQDLDPNNLLDANTKFKETESNYMIVVKLDAIWNQDEIAMLADTADEVDPSAGFGVYLSKLPVKKFGTVKVVVNGKIYKQYKNKSELERTHYTSVAIVPWSYLYDAYDADGQLWYGLVIYK